MFLFRSPVISLVCFSVELGDLLGEGEFGQVVKGYAISLWGRMQPTVVAVKMLKGNITWYYLLLGIIFDDLTIWCQKLFSALKIP